MPGLPAGSCLRIPFCDSGHEAQQFRRVCARSETDFPRSETRTTNSKTRTSLVSQFVESLHKGEHSHNSSFALDVTTDSALSKGLTVVYRNDPRLGAMP